MKTLFTLFAFLVQVCLIAQNRDAANTFQQTPVPTIANFSANYMNNGINLSWQTSHGNNISRYEIEKSTLGSNFSQVGLVLPSKSAPAEYNYFDGTPIYGKNYYRLSAVKNNGDVAYSKVIEADNGLTKTEMRVLPNPVIRGNLQVQFFNFDEGRYNVSLFSNSGMRVLAKTLTFPEGRSSQQIALPGYLPSGSYFLLVSNGKASFQKQVFVK